MPKIKTTDQSYVTDAGKPIVMAIPYSAYPKPEAQWLFGSSPLPKDDIHTSADRTEYQLKDPKKTDEGRYKVFIKNKHGDGEAFIHLAVVGKSNENQPIRSFHTGSHLCYLARLPDSQDHDHARSH